MTNLFLKYKVKMNGFISNINKESGKMEISFSLSSNHITCRNLINALLKQMK